MRKHLSIFAFLLSAVFAVAPAVSAFAFNYFIFSTHPSAFVDYDGEQVSVSTDLKSWSIGDGFSITAQESGGLKFLGWYTKSTGWGNGNPSIGDCTDLITTDAVLSSQRIDAAGKASGLSVVLARYVITGASPSSGGQVTASVNSDGTLKLTATPNGAGYAFDGWTDGGSGNPRTVSEVTAGATYTAKFKERFTTVTLEKQGGSGGTDSVVATNGQPLVAVQIPGRTGYKFNGYWTGLNGSGTQYYTSTGTSARNWAEDGVTVLNAAWLPRTCHVTFNDYGADKTHGQGTLDVSYGATPGPVSIPAKTDASFTGYFYGETKFWDAAGQWKGGTWNIVDEAIVVSARYAEDEYTVKYDSNGGSGKCNPETHAASETFALPDGSTLSKANASFDGWAMSADGKRAYAGGQETSVAANREHASQNPNELVFFAHWASRQVRFFANGAEASVSTNELFVGPGKPFGELATARWDGDRYTFAGWWTAATGGEQVTAESVVPEGTSALDLYAHWEASGYTVAFDGNGKTSGTMPDQGLKFDCPQALSSNAFVKTGYSFAGWATNETEALGGTWRLADGATVKNLLAREKDEVVTLYAVWSTNSYEVAFFGNGGTNEMERQSFTYDVPQQLNANAFIRPGCNFVGWALDPAGEVAYTNCETVANLTPDAGGVVALFAKWSSVGSLTNPYSIAADCDKTDNAGVTLELTPDNAAWCPVVSNAADAVEGGNDQYVKLMPTPPEKTRGNVSLKAELSGSGTLSFYYKTQIKYENDANHFVFNDGRTGTEVLRAETNVVGWAKYEYCKSAPETKTVEWLFNVDPNGWADGDYALVDFIKWDPQPREALMVGVTFRLNDGTSAPDDIFTNITCEAGKAIGALPVPAPKAIWAGEFLGWTTTPEGSDYIQEPWSVPAAEPVQLFAHWTVKPRTEVKVPVAISGLVYDGTEKTGVAAGADYALVGNVATNAGDYVAVATLTGWTMWPDGSLGPTNIAWTIAKGTNDMSGITFPDATFKFDGQPHSFGIVGKLPEGVSVAYSGETSRTEVGTNTVTASFTVADPDNWAAITMTLTATLAIISDSPEPPPGPVPEPMVTNAVPAAIEGLVYDGTEKIGVLAGTGYSIVGNVATNAGAYLATATLEEGHVWADGSSGPTNIAWSIAKGTNDMSGVTFPNATFEYDGKPHSFGIAGELPEGVSVAYSGETNRTEVGTNTVTASFVVADTNNWDEIALTLTARLVILPIDGILHPNAQTGTFTGTAAATYNGWLEDPESGALLAVLQVKTKKAKSGVCATTVYVTPVGGKKKTYKSTIRTEDGNPTDAYGIVYGALGLTGFTHGFVNVADGARVQASKDFPKSKDPDEKSLSTQIPVGTWTVAARTATGGYDCFSVAVAKTGKATVKGTLSEGTSLSASCYGALGTRAFAVPIVYSKDIRLKDTGVKTHVEFAGMLWIAADRLAVLASESARWTDADADELALWPGSWTVGFTLPAWRNYLARTDDGYDVSPTGLPITLTDRKKLVAPAASGSVKVDSATAMTFVKPSGSKAPANLSKLKLSLTAKTGQVKGSFKLYYLNGGKLKTDFVTVTGTMVGERFHGNATVKKTGSTAIWFE